MGKADLHMHTIHSFDGTATVRAVLKQAALAGLDVVAVTDHDSANDLRTAIESGATHPEQVNFEAPGRILLRWLRHYAIRKFGWVTDNAAVNRPPGWARLKTA